MPYIEASERHALDEGIPVTTPGQLNYCITRLVDGYIRHKGLRYATLNEAIGVLECTKLELYRRVGSVYEDNKLCDNGEVYTTILGMEAHNDR